MNFLFKKIISSILFFIVSYTCVYAQNYKNDSLWAAYQNTHLHDTLRLKALHDIFVDRLFTNPDSAYAFATKQLTYAGKVKNEYWEADALHLIGSYYNYIGNRQKALDNLTLSLEIFEKISNKETFAKVNASIGYVYGDMGNYPQALNYFFNSIKANLSVGNKHTDASALIGIANIYVYQADYDKALSYFLKTLKVGEETENKKMQAVCFSGIGNIYLRKASYPKALNYYFKALKIYEELDDKYDQSNAIASIGAVYFEQGNFPKALDNMFEAITILENIKVKNLTETYYVNIGLAYLHLKKYKEAEQYLIKGMKLAYEIQSLKSIKDAHLGLSELYEKSGKPILSLEHYKKYITYKDSVYNEENIKKQTHSEIQYEFDKKATIAKAEQEKKDILALKEKQQQQLIVYITSAGLLVFLLLTTFIYRGYSQKKKLSLNLAHKNQEITDSINYAKKIQEAILPTDDEFKMAFPESFVLFKPKDIVSGDFYWISADPNEFPAIDKAEGENWRVKNPLIAAVDCTGHGVPGSLMSMMGNSLLNKIIDTHKISKPNEILGALRNEIINSLKQHGENENKDGMDIALCAVFEDKIEFAGANNPLYIIRKNGNLEEIKGDKMPISYTDGELKPYTNHTVKMEKGDCLYILTDGYADQFGGPSEKKFKYKPLKDLLVTIHSSPLEEQKQILTDTIENWKGENEQTDDILIIGIRV